MLEPTKITAAFCLFCFISLFNTAGIICMDKWGVIKHFERLINRERCEFCILFWTGFTQYLVFAFSILGWYKPIEQILLSFTLALAGAALSSKFLR